jgi:hypothetical protein
MLIADQHRRVRFENARLVDEFRRDGTEAVERPRLDSPIRNSADKKYSRAQFYIRALLFGPQFARVQNL